jgi:hypothetical protein
MARAGKRLRKSSSPRIIRQDRAMEGRGTASPGRINRKPIIKRPEAAI